MCGQPAIVLRLVCQSGLAGPTLRPMHASQAGQAVQCSAIVGLGGMVVGLGGQVSQASGFGWPG